MPWVESASPSFAARHHSSQTDAAAGVLDALERFRSELAGRFQRTPGEIAVVIHERPFLLALAHPWLPLARAAAAPASRRYFAGWFSAREIHVLAPDALERRASGVAASRDALLRTPQHEYAHLVLGANNPELPPPFTPRSFRRYLELAWLCEGGAAHFSGQTPLLRAAIVRRLRDGATPTFPPSPRDAQLLGGTLYTMLEQEAGPEAAVSLATARAAGDPRGAIARAFGRDSVQVERDWLEYLTALPPA